MTHPRQSVAIILSVGGATLDSAALRRIPMATLVRAEFASGDRAACVAATLAHECDTAELARALRSWAASWGWTITVAPLRGSG
ncbi:MAG: hypothetical protein OEO20_03575 [Gemmatimonadota bacterium]|nr:hypothetical protein [Gemmatimonadota bacterium]MDH3366694.1 hypothetical protein [Gemmatimonadota bacterium]MDH3477365.1 hypothetical protein [Gemmatimonadota bacterium]MDH3569323.1 hypothetical protein [Gemmatimonadota bacterium]MDH5549126.1 hypothetical protein [Gemmatimonadota bacterium]